MIEGQMMDMLAQTRPFDPETEPGTGDGLNYLKSMHHRKTGRMIMASLEGGVVSVNGDDRVRDALAVYAQKIGLAFQVTDDVLNIEGDPATMGKAAGSDAENHKMTFPSLLGLERSKAFAVTLVEEAVAALDRLHGAKTEALEGIARYILTRKR